MQDELVRRAQQGDHEAFCLLAERAVGRLRGTARLIVRDAWRADDAVQEALVAAWRHLPSLRDPSRIDAWLQRLLVNACRRVARGEQRRQVMEIRVGPDQDGPASESRAPIEVRDGMERAFGRLSEEHRTLLALVYYADLPVAEAATALGIPLGTAKSRLHRALDAMRAALAAEERVPDLAMRRPA